MEEGGTKKKVVPVAQLQKGTATKENAIYVVRKK